MISNEEAIILPSSPLFFAELIISKNNGRNKKKIDVTIF